MLPYSRERAVRFLETLEARIVGLEFLIPKKSLPEWAESLHQRLKRLEELVAAEKTMHEDPISGLTNQLSMLGVGTSELELGQDVNHEFHHGVTQQGSKYLCPVTACKQLFASTYGLENHLQLKHSLAVSLLFQLSHEPKCHEARHTLRIKEHLPFMVQSQSTLQ
jgi:hypothetical protein